MNVQVGDWIRFMRGGQLVVGTVAYIVPRKRGYDSTPEAMTIEHGQVSYDDIIELRRGEPTHG
ncbi:MAG TPA: hypothetical protein VF491_17610 [Vicinamibacterales bacterium]